MKWIQYIAILILSCFFLIFGIDLLIATYAMANPILFVVSFFASNLIILISLVGMTYCFFRIRSLLRAPQEKEK
ncbi:MAG: hypothetical protein K9K75_00960 [Deltaproteobacteria bacterium]|nr:hypothetical protein [Deltaproteobacteria bacterium]